MKVNELFRFLNDPWFKGAVVLTISLSFTNSAMENLVDQRVCLKFCVANKISCAESLKMLQKTYGTSCMSKTQAYGWYKAFKEAREVVVDLPRSGRPPTARNDENINKIQKLMLEAGARMSLRELAQEMNISFKSVHNILTDILGMKRVAGRLVPKELNFVQKKYRKQVAEDMISQVSADPTFMHRIVTGHHAWIYEFDTRKNQQSSEYCLENEPKSKKTRQSHSRIKAMLTVFFDYRGVVHCEYLPDKQTANKEYYLEVLKRLRESIRKKRPELWKDNSWILHHDTTPPHEAIIIREFLAENSTKVIAQAPYSPDMSPFDFFLFAKLKLSLRRGRFQAMESMKENWLKELKAIPQSAYMLCMEDWVKRWSNCIVNDGAYFEGDKTNFDE